LEWQDRNDPAALKKKGVDEADEKLHNLIPLLLTNKTIRRIQQGSTE
jgi:hypothetical protein